VDLKKITMPLLNFYGQYDHLVPPEACNKLTRAVGSSDTEDICLKTGHIGIYVSSKCQQEFTPKICSWLKQHDHPPQASITRKMTRRKTASQTVSPSKKVLKQAQH
jgi:polyhydroxyalkanoate synthase